jgi:hypothetical protein
LAKIAKGGRNEVGFASYDDPGASIDALTAQPAQHAAVPDLAATATGISQQQQCHTPHTKEAAKKQRKLTSSKDLTPSRYSSRISEKTALAQKDMSPQGNKFLHQLLLWRRRKISRGKGTLVCLTRKRCQLRNYKSDIQNGRKVYVNFSDDSDDEDYVAEDSSNNN